MARHHVTVGLGERSYEVRVGPGAIADLPDLLADPIRRVAVVTQEGIPVSVDPGVEHRTFLMGDGEEAKSMRTVETLCSAFSRWGLTRADAIVAVGGGVVTDTAGFAAASYHRGVPVYHVSTTLLGQVDAAIGGKTGVNLPEGKNLVGAFWQPAGVICDTDTLSTLSARQRLSGSGELAKYHFLGADDLTTLDLPAQVARCVALKASFVADDERESGRRALLNYGHTLAHALETTGDYALSHGEAVAVGLSFAARLAHRMDRIRAARVAEHDAVLDHYGLPSRPPANAECDELVAAMARDKKATVGLTFILDGPDGPEVVADVDRDTVRAVLEEFVA